MLGLGAVGTGAVAGGGVALRDHVVSLAVLDLVREGDVHVRDRIVWRDRDIHAIRAQDQAGFVQVPDRDRDRIGGLAAAAAGGKHRRDCQSQRRAREGKLHVFLQID